MKGIKITVSQGQRAASVTLRESILFVVNEHIISNGWTLILLFLTATILTLPTSGQCQNTEEDVLEAYALRMGGKSDAAKIALESILQKDSGYAMANFEMARLLESENALNTEEILHYCDLAIANDPQNALYAFYRARLLLLKAYIAMHQDDNDQTKKLIGESCIAFQHVLEMDPACKEAMLYLADNYASLPEEMGGDQEQAESFVQMLEDAGPLYGAKGRVLLTQGNIDETDFWKDYLSQNGEDLQALELLGRAYLMEDDIVNAETCFNKRIEADPAKQILVLDLARAHLLRVMQGKGSNEEDLAQAKKYYNAYLNSDVEKPVSVEAWCYGFLSRVEMFLENKEGSEEYLRKANELYPNFSRAFAIPPVDVPPNVLTYVYSSFFKPF